MIRQNGTVKTAKPMKAKRLPAGVKVHADQSAALKKKLNRDDGECTAGGVRTPSYVR